MLNELAVSKKISNRNVFSGVAFMGIMKVGVRCQQCGGRISMGRLLEICPGCGAQGNHAYAVRQRHLQERPLLKRGHQVSLFAIVTFFALVVAASRMGSFMSNDQVVKEERLPEVVQRIGSIEKDIK